MIGGPASSLAPHLAGPAPDLTFPGARSADRCTRWPRRCRRTRRCWSWAVLREAEVEAQEEPVPSRLEHLEEMSAGILPAGGGDLQSALAGMGLLLGRDGLLAPALDLAPRAGPVRALEVLEDTTRRSLAIPRSFGSRPAIERFGVVAATASISWARPAAQIDASASPASSPPRPVMRLPPPG